MTEGAAVGDERLGELEIMVLLTLAALKANSTARVVFDEMTEATGRSGSVAAIHITLERLRKKGLTHSEVRADASRGGRALKEYRLTAGGVEALRNTRARFDLLWSRAAGFESLAPE